MSESASSVSRNRSESEVRVKKRSFSLGTESEIFPRRTLLALAVIATVLLGLLLWTAIAPDKLLFSLAMV